MGTSTLHPLAPWSRLLRYRTLHGSDWTRIALYSLLVVLVVSIIIGIGELTIRRPGIRIPAPPDAFRVSIPENGSRQRRS